MPDVLVDHALCGGLGLRCGWRGLAWAAAVVPVEEPVSQNPRMRPPER